MTTKGPATEGTLGNLHNKVAEVMIGALDTIEKAQQAYDAMDVEVIAEKGIKEPEVNPALLSVMVRFLDSNKVTCAPEQGNTMSDLERKLEEKRKNRRTVGNVVHAFDTE
jgi:NADPH:quinone reductase-like Zn-dependent oxidoreductase